MPTPPDDPRLWVLDLLRRYGWNTTSFQVLEPGYTYWFTPDREAAVAYFEVKGWWVAAGAPICDGSRRVEVSRAFATAARCVRRRVAFFGAGRRLARALEEGEPAGWDCLLVGLEACWNPMTWSADLDARSQVRSQVRRALRKGVTVREAPPAELEKRTPTRAAAQHLMTEWLRGKEMAPLGFLAHLDPFTLAHERRYFVAERDGRLVGLLAAIPVYMRNGWFLEDLLVEARSPPGTSEALIDAAMRSLEAAGVTYASMGMVALAGVGDLPRQDSGHPVLRALLGQCYQSLNWLYGFHGLRSFRSKFKPALWEPVYLVSDQRITLRTVGAVLQAFAGGELGRFAAHTGRKFMERHLSRTPAWLWPAAARSFAWTLAAWVLFLLNIDGQRWFGAAWMARAWASFDVGVAVAMGLLARGLRLQARWSRWLNQLLLGAVLADVWMTTAQALLYHGAGPTSRWEMLMLGTAVAAPYLAATYLFLLLFAPKAG